MAIIVINPRETREFVSSYDVSDPNDHTIFVLGTIPNTVMSYIKDHLSAQDLKKMKKRQDGEDGEEGSGSTRFLIGNYGQMVVRHGVKDIKNLRDENGKEIPYRTESVHVPGVGPRNIMDRRIYDMIPSKVLEELNEAILDINEPLDEEKEKNSDSPSS